MKMGVRVKVVPAQDLWINVPSVKHVADNGAVMRELRLFPIKVARVLGQEWRSGHDEHLLMGNFVASVSLRSGAKWLASWLRADDKR